MSIKKFMILGLVIDVINLTSDLSCILAKMVRALSEDQRLWMRFSLVWDNFFGGREKFNSRRRE